MSQPNRKYKRLEALLSESRPTDPNPASRPVNGELDAMKARLNELERDLVKRSDAAGSHAKKDSDSLAGARQVRISKHSTENAPRQLLDETQRARNAFRVALIVLGAMLTSMPVYIYAAIPTNAWQVYVIMLCQLILSIVYVISAGLARRNRVNLSVGLVIGGAGILVPIIVALIAGLGLALGVTLFLAVLAIVGQTLTGPAATRATAAGVTFAIITLLIEWFAPWNRLSVPALINAAPYIAGGVILVLGTVAIGPVWRNLLANISIGWKMALMVSVLVLGIAGVTTIAIRSLQRLQFHNSNLYEFMLIPIIDLDNANAQLADVEYQIRLLEDSTLPSTEKATAIGKIQAGQQAFRAVFERYNAEWITTVSPEFTDLLREQGRLDLQEDEVATVNLITDSLGRYDTAVQAYLKAGENGLPGLRQTQETISALQELRGHFDHLVAVNKEFAKLSFETAATDYSGALVNGSITVGIAIVFGLFLSYLIVVSITGRLSELTRSASAMQQGDLNQAVAFTGRDEVSSLGMAFNSMAGQLRDLFSSLEKRVAERTQDLEVAAEVGRAVSERSADLYGLLKDAVELISQRFHLYYVQIYLVDTAGRALTLRAGSGKAGAELLLRGHSLPLNTTSINGRAAAERVPVIVADTVKSANFLPNPLLTNTRSEMSIPLIAGGKVVGVLDMQSSFVGTLNETNLPAFETLAGQLSIAIQNATLFEQSEEAREQVEANVRQVTQTGWQDFLNAIERGEKIGYTFNQVEVRPIENVNGMISTNALNVPIMVTGANVGTIQLVEEDRNWTPQETEIVHAAAVQLAQHIDNLRLLAMAESYQFEAEQAVRRLTRRGWETFLQTRSELSSGFTYDLNDVHTLERGNNNGHFESGITKQFAVRNETIGELAVKIGDKSPQDINELITAVAEQLGDHIENLRLSEQNEKRAFELATVATVSTTASTVLDPDKLLQSVVDLTKERFNIYHTHIYLADESWKTLLLAAGAGDVGRQMVADGHAIQTDAERSLVARAARERRAIIANDVQREADFLPNPMLPKTRAEMAVPMIAGDKVIGVFDVQSDAVGHFTEADANIYTTLASQVAVALQNARLYVEQSATVTQLRELDRLKSSFLANMSHELRTPLNSILGFADVMLEELDGPLTENMNNDLGLIQKNGQHLLHLINDVLDMAKIESGKMNLNPETFKIHEILEDVTSITSAMANEKKVGLTIEKDSDQKLEIYADRTRLRQVMINIVSNAIKFTEHGKISVHAKQVEERVLISIKDTGIGISPDKLEAVFQEFTQVDVSSTRKSGGTGLGLPISRRLIEMHGGRIWAESSGVTDEGCTFYVELPIEAKIAEPIEKREK